MRSLAPVRLLARSLIIAAVWFTVGRAHVVTCLLNRVRALLCSEPRALFMLIEFMLFDKDQSGTIDFDETTAVFRTRYGKEAMEKVVKVKRRALMALEISLPHRDPFCRSTVDFAIHLHEQILEDQGEVNKKMGGTDVQLDGITFSEFLKNEQLVSAVLDA